MFHCFFEQSGTFKNEFLKLGYNALDYDCLNDFGQTDKVIDLFNQIEYAYNGCSSIFDNISTSDMIIAFFPCVRFECQIIMAFKGTQFQLQNLSDLSKLEYDLKLHDELHYLYNIITKLVIVCIRRNIPLIIENPYSSQHYLIRYWSLEPGFIDKDRMIRGDYYNKPTAYWFVNCKPKFNFILEPQFESVGADRITHTSDKVKRSLISPEYANRFIREFILD